MLLLAHVSWGAGADGSRPTATPRRGAEENRNFAALCKRRAAGVPIAYLLGEAEFYHRAALS